MNSSATTTTPAAPAAAPKYWNPMVTLEQENIRKRMWGGSPPRCKSTSEGFMAMSQMEMPCMLVDCLCSILMAVSLVVIAMVLFRRIPVHPSAVSFS